MLTPSCPFYWSAVLSMICGFVAMPLILRFCIKHKVYDEPNARKVHHNNIPRLGGVAFLPSMVLSCLITLTTFNSLCLDHTVSLNLADLHILSRINHHLCHRTH